MTLLLTALSIVGAIAVVAFVVFLVVALRSGREAAAARGSLTLAGAAAGVCALLGVLIAFTGQ